ncbi:hypothetical protein FIBSPDRAFT_897650 [Athelia psychrophila]|uniref:Uncharacterized protein n=1 Tax=Athelia psychrophila TaxID=1759441 RepID=A0A166C021_9AGAM|nr:hypothetical protein FIBSPDRAFT_897650 [Fibularhizoctonia sp. CBS 109695]
MYLLLRHQLSLRIQVRGHANNYTGKKPDARVGTSNVNGSRIGYSLSVNSSYGVIATFTAVGLNGTISDLHEATMDPYAQHIAIGTGEYNTPNIRDSCEMS